MDKAVQPAPAGKGVHYERRRPEETILYQLVQEHLETFLAQVEGETGADLPDFVKEEFDAFLECGILAHGFLRLRCAGCAHEKLVAFSCKKRGFCPACGSRRMAETAAHLVDHVIPRVAVRQWVLSFPIPLRFLFASHPQLLAPVLHIIQRVIATFPARTRAALRAPPNRLIANHAVQLPEPTAPFGPRPRATPNRPENRLLGRRTGPQTPQFSSVTSRH